MGAKPDESNVLRGATVFVGAVGCVFLCFRVARLLAVGLALGLRKHGKDEVKNSPT